MRRRSPAPVTAVALLLWCASTAFAAAPTPPPAPAPVIDPGPSGQPTRTTSRDPSADPTDRWIVVLKPGSDAVRASAAQGRKNGFTPEHLYRHAVKGYAARLNRGQLAAGRLDPAVALVVPDERIELESQTMPTGITRIGANRSAVAKIDGSDERVDADVAVVDTGIAPLADLNVVGGINCSTSDPTAWRDINGHGTHVAGTVGAIDNASGVVGV